MRITPVTASLFLMFGSALAQNPPGQDPPSRVARLNMINGAVSFQPASVDDWTNATLNYPMTTGDHLYADAGARAEMHIGPNVVRLDSRTNFGFLNLDDRTAQIRLTEGSINVRVRSLLDSDVWEIDTPNGAITLLRTGDYRIDTDPNRNATMVTVISGEAEATSNGQAFPLHTRQTGYFAGDGSQPDIRSANYPDEFDQFCMQRDRREDAVPAPRYVSREMVGYEDLDSNGTWTEVADYGPIWRPRVAVGWVPYHDGHWAWVEPWGWTWIDAAPWGFAPFHYGRWAYVGGGWGWCPGPRVAVIRPVYAPALVAFVGGGGWSASLRFGGGEGVAWFPLGYNEPYIPAYHVSPTYVRQVNVTNVTYINNVTINKVVTNYNTPGYVHEARYANQEVRGAVTAVPRQAFISAQSVQRTAVTVPENTFARARVGGYTASVAPERGSVLRQASGNVSRPDAAIMNRQVVARNPPPPSAVPFVARQQALQANQGRPLAPQQIQTLRQSAPVNAPSVRIAGRPGPPALPQPALPQNAQPGPNQPVTRLPEARQVIPQGQPQRQIDPPVQQVAPQRRDLPPDRMNSRPPAVTEREQRPQVAQPVTPRQPEARPVMPQGQPQRQIDPPVQQAPPQRRDPPPDRMNSRPPAVTEREQRPQVVQPVPPRQPEARPVMPQGQPQRQIDPPVQQAPPQRRDPPPAERPMAPRQPQPEPRPQQVEPRPQVDRPAVRERPQPEKREVKPEPKPAENKE